MPRAFSFAEVMFAVVILGIGFIMVAAVFPVAIQQTQNNGEENIAAALARQAANSIASLPTTISNPLQTSIYEPNPNPNTLAPVALSSELLFPPTVKNYIKGSSSYAVSVPPAIVVPMLGSQWNQIQSNAILTTDPRYGFVAFYKRDANSSAAQLILIAVANRNRPVYEPAKDTGNASANTQISTTTPAAFPSAQPTQTTICPDTVVCSSVTNAATEGYYLSVPGTLLSPAPAGRTYALGAYISSALGSEMLPGYSMEQSAGANGWGTSGALIDKPIGIFTQATLYTPATLQPNVAYSTLQATAAVPFGQITFVSPTTDTASLPPSAVQGAFVIIADDYPLIPGVTLSTSGGSANYPLPDTVNGINGYSVGALNGRIFRLGTPVPGSPGVFNLDPAYGMRPAAAGANCSPDQMPNPNMVLPTGASGTVSAKVYIIGAGRSDPTATTTNNYTGPAQDIGIYSTFFQVQ